jgi:hypothetical protein
MIILNQDILFVHWLFYSNFYKVVIFDYINFIIAFIKN